MRFFACSREGKIGTGIERDGVWRALFDGDDAWPGTLDTIVANGTLLQAGALLASAPTVDRAHLTLSPPISAPQKIVCVGLNYRDHSSEVSIEQPAHPTLFTRFASTLVGDGAAIVRPCGSEQLDYEGEIAAVIGKAGRHISLDRALDHVAGWSLFNDASVRDYQFRTPQWTLGKNFDATGAFGPLLVTPDELPPGLTGVMLETRLNGATVQSASVDDMVFDVASIITAVSEVMTLQPGDVIVTGTPAGVGMARKPPLWLRPGDRIEVTATGLGILTNVVAQEYAA